MSAQLLLCPDPITLRRQRLTVAVGSTLAELDPHWRAQAYIALVNGRPVLRADWSETRLGDGDVAVYAALPQGAIAAVFVAWVASSAATSIAWWVAANYAITTTTLALIQSAATVALYAAGSTLVNGLIPTPSAPQGYAGESASPTYSLTSASNQARVNQPIPVIYGRMRVMPDLCTAPYAYYQTQGGRDEQYLVQTLMIGQGEYDIEQIAIDDTPIERYADVTHGVLAPGQAAPAHVRQHVHTSPEVADGELTTGAPVVYTAVPEGRQATRIEVDLTCPRGLYRQNSDGSLSARRVVVRVEARAVGGTDWTALTTGTLYSDWGDWQHYCSNCSQPPDTETEQYRTQSDGSGSWVERRTRSVLYAQCQFIEAATVQPQRRTHAYDIAPGRYEVRVTRLDDKDTSHMAGHQVNLSSLRADLVPPDGWDPAYGQTTRLWIVMRASEQLSQLSARRVSVTCTRRLPVWTGSGWSTPQATRSIAWALADALRAPYGARLSDARIDLDALAALDAVWSTRGDWFDAVFDARLTVWEAVGRIARAGRARPYIQGGRVRIARDAWQPQPVMLFTPDNIVAGSLGIQYLMPSEATAEEVRVRYHSSSTWKPAEAIYTLPSADEDKVAEVDLFGVTTHAHALREARYLAQANRWRRRIVQFDTELEGLILSPLDTILVSHDLPEWGQWGRIERAEVVAGGTELVIDPPPRLGAGAHYIRIAGPDGAPGPALPVTAGQRLPIRIDQLIDVRDGARVAVGEGMAWQALAKVTAIRPKDERHATVIAVIDREEVHANA